MRDITNIQEAFVADHIAALRSEGIVVATGRFGAARLVDAVLAAARELAHRR